MSIIYDALKKTQQSRLESAMTAQRAVVIPRTHYLKISLFLMFGILVLCFFGYEKFTRVNKVAVKLNLSKNKFAALEKAKQNIKISGIFLSDKIKVAMIDSQMYHVGDSVGELKIIGIQKDAVKFRHDTDEFTVRVTA